MGEHPGKGEFWAVQCKYRQDTDHSLTWRDISTFTGLAFGVCRRFAFGIICSTTERITHVLKNQDRIGFCALDVWQGLDAGFFSRLRAHLAHTPKVWKPLKPRPHLKGAFKAGHGHFVIRKAKRGKLIMTCGSGKSLTAETAPNQPADKAVRAPFEGATCEIDFGESLQTFNLRFIAKTSESLRHEEILEQKNSAPGCGRSFQCRRTSR